jgi:hypothetical protein
MRGLVGASSSTVCEDVRLPTTIPFSMAGVVCPTLFHRLPRPTAPTAQCEDLFSEFVALPSHYCRPVRAVSTASRPRKRCPKAASPHSVAREACLTRKLQHSCHDTRTPLPATWASERTRHPTDRNVRYTKAVHRRRRHGHLRLPHHHHDPLLLLPPPLPPSRKQFVANRPAVVHSLSRDRQHRSAIVPINGCQKNWTEKSDKIKRPG